MAHHAPSLAANATSHGGLPASADDHAHGHVIMPLFTLRAVLVALLFFTFLTVGVAWVEKWVMTTFDVSIPWWVNVSVVLVIATIKSVLVCMYFMQLKFDNPINSIIFGFCLFALALFMGFTIIDLHSRDLVYDYKKGEVIAGGTGAGIKATDSLPVSVFAKQRVIESRFGGDIAAFDEALADYKAKHSHGHGHGEDHAASSEERSRPRAGLTPGLFEGNGAAGAGEHGGSAGDGGHGGH